MTPRRKSFQKGYVFERRTKSRGKEFVIRYRQRTADGKWKHLAETLGVKTKKEAQAVLAKRLENINGGQKLPATVHFEEFVTSHWETYLKQNLKSSTQASHRSNAKAHLLPAFGKTLLAEITPADVLEFLSQKRKDGLSQKTLLNLYVLLQRMLNLAVDLELIPASPMRRVPKPKVERSEKPTLTPAQVRAVIDAAPENYRALFLLLYLTGIRIGEALALKWQDVDFSKAKLYIRRSVWRGQEQTPKSKASIRGKHLLSSLAQGLARHRELSFYTNPDSYVFVNGAGKPLDPDDLRKRVLYPAMDKAEIQRTKSREYGFHLFRHSAGSEFHEATGDLKQTQSFLGHSGIAITGDTYVHLRPDAEIEAMRKLEQAVFPELCSTVPKSSIQAPAPGVN